MLGRRIFFDLWAIDQLDQRHRCVVADAETHFQDTRVATRTRVVARAKVGEQLDDAVAIAKTVERKALDLGLRHYSKSDLEAVRRRGETIEINVLGLASIAADVPVELARATISSITVLGALQATPDMKAALADRVHAAGS